MQWSDIPWTPTSRVLRQFAVLWLLALGGLACWHGFVREHSLVAIILESLDSEFEKVSSEQGPQSLLGEFWEYLGQSRKWWLLHILVVLLLFGLLALLAGTGAAPFIYTLF